MPRAMETIPRRGVLSIDLRDHMPCNALLISVFALPLRLAPPALPVLCSYSDVCGKGLSHLTSR